MVVACAASTPALVADEAKFNRCAAIGVYVSSGACTSVDTVEVRAAIEDQLLIPSSEMEVSLYTNGFLVLFSDGRLRDHALDCQNGIDLGGARLFFRPWLRMANSTASRLLFKMRLCIEGVPPHARQPETLKQLFDPNTLIECIDAPLSDKETACCCVQLWTSDPDGFALEGILNVDEPMERGGRRWSWNEPPRQLGYAVVLHLDYTIDYSPPATQDAAWPKHQNFIWALGLRDDNCAATSRRPVHERLGSGRRDRSPSSGPDNGGRDSDNGRRHRRPSRRNGTGTSTCDGGSSSRDYAGFVNTTMHYGHRHMGCLSRPTTNGPPPLQ